LNCTTRCCTRFTFEFCSCVPRCCCYVTCCSLLYVTLPIWCYVTCVRPRCFYHVTFQIYVICVGCCQWVHVCCYCSLLPGALDDFVTHVLRCALFCLLLHVDCVAIVRYVVCCTLRFTCLVVTLRVTLHLRYVALHLLRCCCCIDYRSQIAVTICCCAVVLIATHTVAGYTLRLRYLRLVIALHADYARITTPHLLDYRFPFAPDCTVRTWIVPFPYSFTGLDFRVVRYVYALHLWCVCGCRVCCAVCWCCV